MKGVLLAQTKSVDETRLLAAELAGLARPGDLILLAGDLGSGKTAFAQGFARGLGIEEPVTSPTFTLVRPYEGRLRLLHADVYRLDRLQEVIDLALVEQVDDRDAVALVEWGDLAEPVLPADFLEVRLEFGAPEDDETRQLRLRMVGASWPARRAAISAALGRWLVSPPE